MSEHGHVDARVALATDPQVVGAVVGEHAEPVAQERVVVLSFVTTSTTTKRQSVVFNNKSVFSVFAAVAWRSRTHSC